MTITHIVAFKVPETNLPVLKEGMLSLKDNCLKEGKPYILSLTGGKQTSPEGKDHGLNVVFSLEFENAEDLDYYIWHDPVHVAFKEKVGSLDVSGVAVLDFTPGAW